MKSDLTVQIGKKLKEIRISQGFTQETLAELAEISASFLGMIERGERVLSVMTLFRLCKALDIPSDALLCTKTDSVREGKIRYSGLKDPVLTRMYDVLKDKPAKNKKLALHIVKKLFEK